METQSQRIMDDIMDTYSVDSFVDYRSARPDWAKDQPVHPWLLKPENMDVDKANDVCARILCAIHKFCLKHGIQVIDNSEQPAWNDRDMKIMLPLMAEATPFLAGVLLHEFAHATNLVAGRPNKMGTYGNGIYCVTYANEEVVAETASVRMMDYFGYSELGEDYLWRPASYIWSFRNYYKRVIHATKKLMEQERKNLPGLAGALADLMWTQELWTYQEREREQNADSVNIPTRVDNAVDIMIAYT